MSNPQAGARSGVQFNPRTTKFTLVSLSFGFTGMLFGCAQSPSPTTEPSMVTTTQTVFETATNTPADYSLCSDEDLAMELVETPKASPSLHFTNTSSERCYIDPGYLIVVPTASDGSAVATAFEYSPVSDHPANSMWVEPGGSAWAVIAYSNHPETGAEIANAVKLVIYLRHDAGEFTIPLDGPMYYGNGDLKVSGYIGPLTAEQQLG